MTNSSSGCAPFIQRFLMVSRSVSSRNKRSDQSPPAHLGPAQVCVGLKLAVNDSCYRWDDLLPKQLTARAPTPLGNSSADLSLSKGQRSRKQRSLFLGLVIVALAGLGALAITRVGNWLVVQDPLQRSPAVVVLGGQVPFRAMEAAAIYRQGWAHEVWLTRRTTDPDDEAFSRIGIEVVSGEALSQNVLEKLGVPKEAIRTLDERVRNTADEVRVIAQEMEKMSTDRVIIVTSKFHTRRVRVLWHTLNGGRVGVIVRFTPDDPSDPDHWWRNSGDSMAVSREVFGLMNAWAGFPIGSGQR